MPKQWHLLKYSEWQDACGYWNCNDVSTLVGASSRWWTPARMLGIAPSEFVELLVTKFKPDNISYSYEYDVLCYSWKSQAEMRKFKNWINAEARRHQFYCT